MPYHSLSSKAALRHAAAAVALIAALPNAQSQDAVTLEKNGRPCVAELCLGDGLPELAKIKWDRAKNIFSKTQTVPYSTTRKLRPNEVVALGKLYRGEINPVGAYLKDNMFDSESLPALGRVNVACERNELVGTFTTKSGNSTRVAIMLTPVLAEPGQHRWTVISIVRNYPAAITNVQVAELEKQLTGRYHAYGANNIGIKNAKAGEGRFFFLRSPTFGFHLQLFRGGMAEVENMKQHPACGGAAKLSVD